MKKIKFSIIIPVYNTSKYLEKCLDSVFSQSYNNYEVIIVNDGSTDNSEEIINKYQEKIVYLKQKNQGLSVARNNGIKKATGDYLLFLDSDDYLDTNLLKELASRVTDEDVVRFQLRTTDYTAECDYYESEFFNLNGNEAFANICHYHFIELACIYAFKKSYWFNNKYEFKKNMYHEDFGLIPQVIYNANNVSSINYIGYNYYQRASSIMNENDTQKSIKKMNDMLTQGIAMLKENQDNYPNSLTNHVANSIFCKLNTIDKESQREFIKVIKDNNILNYLYANSFKQKIRNLYYKIKYNL